MVVRRRKKYRKKLGSRSYHGDTKNRRGSGIRGGVGRAGAWDHKFSKFYRELVKKGFKPPRKRRIASINVGSLEEILPRLEREGFVSKEGDRIVLDLTSAGYTRLTGRGTISTPVVVKIAYATQRAVEKIQAAGGQVVSGGSESA